MVFYTDTTYNKIWICLYEIWVSKNNLCMSPITHFSLSNSMVINYLLVTILLQWWEIVTPLLLPEVLNIDQPQWRNLFWDTVLAIYLNSLKRSNTIRGFKDFSAYIHIYQWIWFFCLCVSFFAYFSCFSLNFVFVFLFSFICSFPKWMTTLQLLL